MQVKKSKESDVESGV